MFELSDERRDELVEKYAQMLVDRGLGTAGVFMLEAHKPLSGIGAHAAVAFGPIITPIVNFSVNEVAAFMHRVENIELLIRRVEALEQERAAEQERRIRRRREAKRRARRWRKLRKRGGAT